MRHPTTGKFLAVDESKNRGWWIPGGGLDDNEKFADAAVRECKEEASIDIVLKGILKVEQFLFEGNGYKMRVIYYAEPVFPDQAPKQVEDHESVKAEWVTLEEFSQKEKIRGNELLEFGQ